MTGRYFVGKTFIGCNIGIPYVAFIGLLGYTIWLLNDIGTVETTDTTQEISDVDSINGSVGNNGDVYGESKADSKEN